VTFCDISKGHNVTISIFVTFLGFCHTVRIFFSSFQNLKCRKNAEGLKSGSERLSKSVVYHGGRLGTATLVPLLVAQGVLSYTLTFECMGQCSWKVLNCRRDVPVVQSTEGTVSGVTTMCACCICIKTGRSHHTSRY